MAVADTNSLAPLLPLLVHSDTVGKRGLMALMCCVCYTSHDAGPCHEACIVCWRLAFVKQSNSVWFN